MLQDREFERLGGTATHVMRARVIAATNRDLRAAVAAGAFRADLYFRLNVFHIEVPPLRARRADIPILARAAAQRIAAQLEMAAPPFSDAFYRQLCERDWPGNVRELMNEIERVLIRCHAGLDFESPDGDTAASSARSCRRSIPRSGRGSPRPCIPPAATSHASHVAWESHAARSATGSSATSSRT